MKMKSAFAWLAAVVVGLSLSQAQADTLVVDDFDSLSTPPAGNNWNQSGAPVLGGVREFTKIGGTWQTAPTTPGQLKYNATGSTTPGSSRLEMRYDSVVGTSGWFNPIQNLSAFNTADSYLNVKGSFLTTGSTTAVASISWQEIGGGFTDSTLTLTGAPSADGIYRFKINSFSAPILDMAKVGRVWVRLNNLAAGDSYTDKIFFTDYYVPEPSTFALAGLAVVGLVIARRKKS